ncbi:MAG: hypothetical protein QNI90_11630 [Dinoroseobacter sp.]|nr:hypothetical protein [Dinoroseobacter sp.]
MSEISELEGRLVAAMARIKSAVETREAGAGEAGDTSALEAQLSVVEAERDAARVATEASTEALQAAQSQLSAAQAELAELRESVQSLQTSNADLRLAASEGVTDAGAINTAMAADLAALQRARAADLRDVEALLSQIAPTEDLPHA